MVSISWAVYGLSNVYYRILSNKRPGALEKCLEMGALWSYV